MRKVSIFQLIGIVLMVFFFYSIIIALSDNTTSVRHSPGIESESETYYNH